LSTVVFLPSAGGGWLDPGALRVGPGDATRFATIRYPGWQRYVQKDFSADALVSELTAQIEAKIPNGPIRIIGQSIGAHFGYAAALRLQAKGREVAGLCAIDAFMIASAAPSQGWMARAFGRAIFLLGNRRFGDLARYLRSLFYRALFRLGGDHLPRLLQRFRFSCNLPAVCSADPLFELELSMRLMLRETAPWLATLDRKPVALYAPVILLRTRLNVNFDDAWRRRCPAIKIIEIAGDHDSYFESQNFGILREAFIVATQDWRQ
jgi:thioesterase domain-containing protein